MMKALSVRAYTASSALGYGRAAQLEALRSRRGGLRQQHFDICTLSTFIGEIEGLGDPLSGDYAIWDCRNNRLAARALDQDHFRDAVTAAVARYGADRIGVFIGTSTSGVHSTELAYRERSGDHLPSWYVNRTTHNSQAAAEFVRLELGLDNISSAICTACSSSAKVFAAASRAIEAGICDAAVVGGVDSLCLTTLYGFNALQLVSDEVCRPADAGRRGISIGEAAGFALLEPADRPGDLALLGYGESSDAYHMSTPDPEGHGAARAMRDALQRAGVTPEAIDYVNLHGTATPANDLAEDKAVVAVLGTQIPCSSTKGYTGHTLGAAGILEAVIALLSIEHGYLPASLNTRDRDPALAANILLDPQERAVRHVMSNSFGFGGNNACLLFGVAE